MIRSLTPATARTLSAISLLIGLLAALILGSLWQQKNDLLRGYDPLTAPPVANSENDFGVNVSLEQYTAVERVEQLNKIRSLEIGHVKQSFFFSPAFDWTTADKILADVAAADLDIAVLLDGDPTTGFAPPDNVADYATWAGEFAGRFGNQIDVYFVWDEPNIASHWGNEPINPDLYGALLTAAARAIRENDPTALIATAPLAPTVETSTANLAEPLFLQALYETEAAEAFDIVAARPFGFDHPPSDRPVALDRLNFARLILLREIMVANGDSQKPIWAGNWGWNALPANWTGPPSIWGTVTSDQQLEYMVNGLSLGRDAWPWLGRMYWHHWDPDAPADDPVQGFSLSMHPSFQQPEEVAGLLPDWTTAELAYARPGFHPARPDSPFYTWSGDWEFSPEFGADMSQTADNEPPDTFEFRFVGTDAGLRVRRANYRARFYVLIDGEPANALPLDDNSAAKGWGSALVLNTNDPDSDYIAVEPVATGLDEGQHVMTVTAYRGWDQFALSGVAVRSTPPFVQAFNKVKTWLWGLIFLAVTGAVYFGRQGGWRSWPPYQRLIRAINQPLLPILTAVAAMIVILSGWLTWNSPAAGVFRRLDDFSQLALIFGTATVFYLTPWVIVYGAALVALIALLRLRPAWGLALVAFCFPFYVSQLTKPIAAYRFSPVEIFSLLVFGVAVWQRLTQWARHLRIEPSAKKPLLTLRPADWAALAFTAVATLSLLFTARLDVATNEWRTVIIEPLLFYASWRLIRPNFSEGRWIIDAFVAGGTLVALIGLGQFLTGTNLITAEEGIFRLRSIYGSPNNVALYLGRQLPLLLGLILLGQSDIWPANLRDWRPGRRWWWFAAAFLIQLTAFGLTLSKGGLLISLPAALLVVLALWLKVQRRPVWPWISALTVVGILGYVVLLQLPGIGARLDFRSATAVLRLNLWRSSLPMWVDHFWWGVGLDNFLYEYRSRYILAAAWQEPQLNHPHNLILDLATRLGLFGLLTGLWLFIQPWRLLITAWRSIGQRSSATPELRSVTAGLLGSATAMVAHGLVDHSFFLVDLAFAFYFLLALAVWLVDLIIPENGESNP